MPTAWTLAVLLAAGMAGQPGGGGPARERQPPPHVRIEAHAPFDDARGELLAGPMAERLTVQVRGKAGSPASATLLLRTAPGTQRDQRDAQVSIEAGDLRVYASAGRLTAVSASNPAAYYEAEFDGPPDAGAVARTLRPLPLPELAVMFARGGEPVAQLTPITRRVRWEGTAVPVDPAPTQITLVGPAEGAAPGPAGGAATVVFEYQPNPQDRRSPGRLRLRSFSSPLPGGGDERMLTVTSAWVEPGDPALWKIDTAKRTRVDSLAALGIKVEPPPEKKV
ncbi:MAG: hypothetical protein K2Q09_02410, partial [Phycisphaerales bacterium]|nr:hypothetical protein [Phycisphaerales bacterium]